MDGNWTEWGEWSLCDQPCGTGGKHRNRECTNPVPEFNGEDCVGEGVEMAECNTQECKSMCR